MQLGVRLAVVSLDLHMLTGATATAASNAHIMAHLPCSPNCKNMWQP